MVTVVGRDRELAALDAALGAAIAGRGGVALLIGEPGIGKTQLAHAFGDHAADRGAAVVWGRAWEAGGAPAYWPWIEVLRALVDPLEDTGGLAELAHLVPSIRGRAPELAALDPAAERFRLMDAVSRFLISTSRATPLVIVLDDLHAADLPSLALLHFVARGIRTMRAVVVGTYREVESRMIAEVDAALTKVAQEARSFALSRLELGEVAAWLTANGGDPAFAPSLFAATEGNPLFVVETYRLLRGRRAPSAMPVPGNVRKVIRARLAGLADDTRRAVEAASVLGRRFDARTLAELAVLPPNALAEAVAADVLVELGGDELEFAHVLFRDEAYGEVADREALHAAVARLLRDRVAGDADAPLAELVHHSFGALPVLGVDQTIAWVRDAAARAMRNTAFEEAAGFLRRALDVLPAARDAERCDLLLALARAQIDAGRGTLGREAALEAAAIARRLGDVEELARAALVYGEVFVYGALDPTLLALLDEALRAIPPGDGTLRARLLARLAAARQPADQPELPIAMALDAIAMVRRFDDPAAHLAVLISGGSALAYFADPDERRGVDEETVAIACRRDDVMRTLRGRLRLVFDHVERGAMGDADEQIDAYEALALRVGHPPLLWQAAMMRAMRAIMSGRFADAEALAAEARAIAERVDDANREPIFLFQRLALARASGRSDLFAGFGAESIAVVRRAVLPRYAEPCIAAIQVRLGRQDAARQVLALLPFTEPREAGWVSLGWRAEACLALDEPEECARIYPVLRPLAHRNLSWGPSGMACEGPLSHQLGALAMRADRWDAGEQHFADAYARVDACGMPAHRAWIARDHATMLARRGAPADRDRIARMLDQAYTAASQLDMPALAAAIDSATPPALPRPPPKVGLAIESRPDDRAPPTAGFVLEREGEYWTIQHRGAELRIRDSRGMQLLARLVEHAGRELHVADLLAPDGEAGHVEDAGEVLDRTAIASYRARLADLAEQLADAERRNDRGWIERATQEREAIAGELARAVGLGGRGRRAASSTEKARVNVRQRLLDAISRIATHDAVLGDHLRSSVKTGTYCVYRPPGTAP